jgi:hypothetical protein
MRPRSIIAGDEAWAAGTASGSGANAWSDAGLTVGAVWAGGAGGAGWLQAAANIVSMTIAVRAG